MYILGVINFFILAGLTKSNSKAGCLVLQCSAELNVKKLTDIRQMVTLADADEDDGFLLKAGKKRFARLVDK